jgi:TldD protein
MARARRKIERPGHGLEGDFNRNKTSAFAGLMGRAMKGYGVVRHR